MWAALRKELMVVLQSDSEFGEPDRVWLHSLLNVAAVRSTVMARKARKGMRKSKRK